MQNKIYQIHLDSCPSTQTKLKNEYSKLSQNTKNIVISTSLQTDGVGRSGNKWESLGNDLAFSFSIVPSKCVTLTPLEIGIQIVNYFEKVMHTKLHLKWPNDILLPDNKKCGGVIVNLINKIAIVGVGLNFGSSSNHEQFEYPVSNIYATKNLSKQEFKEIPFNIYEYILNNRLNDDEITEKWGSHSLHINKNVKIVDGDQVTIGTFINIGSSGEAILKTNDSITKKIFNGSLFIN